jgi:ABC-type transport system substrate-binding protein
MTTGGSTSPIYDPHFSPSGGTYAYYAGDPLLFIGNASRKITPAIIEKWEQPDRSTLILKVRPGVKFFNLPPANGREVEARDIVYMLRSMTGAQYPDAKINFPRRALFDGMKDPPQAVDKSTVRIEFTRARSDIVFSLSEERVAVTPEGIREAFGGFDSLYTERADRMVGTGPFIAEKIDPVSGSTWKRNPDYWNKPYPYIDRIETTIIQDQAGLITALIAGQNGYMVRVTNEQVDLAKRGLANVQGKLYDPNDWYRLECNVRLKPLDDPRVRRALATVFDKPAFGGVIFGRGQPQVWRYPGTLPFIFPEAISQDDLSKMPGMRSPTMEDIADARQLLSAAGYTDGFAITLVAAQEFTGVIAFKQVGEYMKEQAEKLLPGVKVNIDATNYTSLLAKTAKPDGWNMVAIGGAAEPSPVTHMSTYYHSKGGRNIGGFNDAQMDTLIESAYEEFDETKRAAILRQSQMLALESRSNIQTHLGLYNAIVRPEIQNLDLGSAGYDQHYQRYLWLKA